MTEAPIIKTQNPKERTFELFSDKENKFIFNFTNKNSTSLLISSIFDDGIVKTFYEKEFSLEKVKENKAFALYDTIDEILEELFPLIDEEKVHIFEDEKNETKYIKIIFDLPIKKFNKVEFYVEEKKKTDLEKINELYDIIITQNKEINDLRKDLNALKKEQKILGNEFKDMKKKMENLEISQNKVLERKNFEKDLIININSSIFKSLQEIDFLIERLKNNNKYKNKKISLNLLFRASRDGGLASDFHRKCDGKVLVLVFIRTTEGEIFGGYTKEGYRSREKPTQDNNAFVFSFLKKKIYNSKKGENTVYDYKSNGPSFSCGIYIYNKMLEDGGHTCSISISCFEGVTKDYEINNGDEYFYIQEIEVYQILFN